MPTLNNLFYCIVLVATKRISQTTDLTWQTLYILPGCKKIKWFAYIYKDIPKMEFS